MSALTLPVVHKHWKDKSIADLPYRNSYSQVPLALRTHLWYSDLEYLAGALAGGFTIITYRANGPYDPYYHPGGHSPRDYPLFAQQYLRCGCYHSALTVEFKNQSIYADDATEGATLDTFVGITLMLNALPFEANIQKLMEDPLTRCAILTRAGERKVLHLEWDVKGTEGFENYADIVLNDDLVPATNQNPVVQYYYLIWAVPASGLASFSCLANINLSYDCIFARPQKMAYGDYPADRDAYMPDAEDPISGTLGNTTTDPTVKVESNPSWVPFVLPT